VIHRPAPDSLFALTALFIALWVGLWPAVDAITVAPETSPPEIAAQEPSSCCEDVTPTEGCTCCDLGCLGAGDAGCFPSTAAATCKCAHVGGQVFVALLWTAADLHLVQVGQVDPADQIGLSRKVQPPVPPPLHRLLTTA
jgi:hypothetical protein